MDAEYLINDKQFEIPICIFFFLRKESTLKVISRLRRIRPKKIYLYGDQGRNDLEKVTVKEVRESVIKSIDWGCEIETNFADTNRGVFGQIALGAKEVLSKEKMAIFLEDDNLPEITFFRYCEELLKKYFENDRILWVTGTNYLTTYKPKDSSDYMFTQHLLPCGWASWSHKFLKYYDECLEEIKDKRVIKTIKNSYHNKALFRNQYASALKERNRIAEGKRPISWDYQMAMAIRRHNLLGISPSENQIENIGVDKFSEHKGSNMNMVMTRRFCSMKTSVLYFPLKHPQKIEIDNRYERKLDRIILPPLYLRIEFFFVKIIKKIIGIESNKSLKTEITSIFKKK
jgi:hypothetical protein